MCSIIHYMWSFGILLRCTTGLCLFMFLLLLMIIGSEIVIRDQFLAQLGWIGSVVVRASDCNQQVSSSIPGHALPGWYFDW